MSNISTQYIAIKSYEGIPVFHDVPQIVSATDKETARILLDLSGVEYVDLIPYVSNDQLFTEEFYRDDCLFI